MDVMYRDCNECNNRTMHDGDICLEHKFYNTAIENALEAIYTRITTIEAIDEESDKLAGLNTAYAMLRGLLK